MLTGPDVPVFNVNGGNAAAGCAVTICKPATTATAYVPPPPATVVQLSEKPSPPPQAGPQPGPTTLRPKPDTRHRRPTQPGLPGLGRTLPPAHPRRSRGHRVQRIEDLRPTVFSGAPGHARPSQLGKGDTSSLERHDRSLLWFTRKRQPGNVILHHRHVRPALIREWSTPMQELRGAIWQSQRAGNSQTLTERFGSPDR